MRRSSTSNLDVSQVGCRFAATLLTEWTLVRASLRVTIDAPLWLRPTPTVPCLRSLTTSPRRCVCFPRYLAVDMGEAQLAAVKEYIAKWNLEDELSNAVNQAIKQDSDDPYRVISDYLRKFAKVCIASLDCAGVQSQKLQATNLQAGYSIDDACRPGSRTVAAIRSGPLHLTSLLHAAARGTRLPCLGCCFSSHWESGELLCLF